MQWFRMYAEFVSDPKVQLLAFEDQRHFVAILCLKCNGTLDSHAASDDYRERMIAKALGLDIASAKEAKRRLAEVGLINDTWQPLKWNERQYQSDSSAERTRRWREKRHGDVTVTDKNRTEQSRADQNSPSRSSQSQTPSSYSPQAIQEPLKRLSGRLRGGAGG